MKKNLLIIISIVFTTFTVNNVFAANIDFEILMHADSGTVGHGHDYYEDGYHLENNSGMFFFRSCGTLHEKFSGSTALYNNQNRRHTTLTKESGESFNLISIDLTEYITDTGMNVLFTGLLRTGGTVNTTFSIDGVSFIPETFYFDDTFTDLIEVNWWNERPGYQFDNIVVNSVPIPGAAWLLGTGLAGLIGIRRRKKK